MNNEELLRLINSIHMDKGIDRELLFESLEAALVSAARKKYTDVEELRIRINRENGDLILLDGDRPLRVLEPSEFGRIAAQTAKQVMIQRIREAESEVVFEDFQGKEDTIVNGTISRVERGTVVLNIGKADGILPRQEQIPSENYRPGDRLRCYVVQVRKKGNKVLIVLSRTHPTLVRELFELEVPEISEHIVEIKGLVREPGYRTKLAVYSSDSKVDAVGACVGIRGNRIRSIVEELNGEKIDIVRWHDSEEIFIRNALSPAEAESIDFDRRRNRARVLVENDQLSLAIGRKGQNVRLSSKLTGWDLDIMTVDQHRKWRELGHEEIASLPGVGDQTINNLLLTGFESFQDIVELGVEELMKIKGIAEKKAEEIYQFALDGYQKRIANDQKAAAEIRQKKQQQKKKTVSMPLLEEKAQLEIVEPQEDAATESAESVEEQAPAPEVEIEAGGESEAAEEKETDAE